jgi:hypothetical protein
LYEIHETAIEQKKWVESLDRSGVATVIVFTGTREANIMATQYAVSHRADCCLNLYSLGQTIPFVPNYCPSCLPPPTWPPTCLGCCLAYMIECGYKPLPSCDLTNLDNVTVTFPQNTSRPLQPCFAQLPANNPIKHDSGSHKMGQIWTQYNIPAGFEKFACTVGNGRTYMHYRPAEFTQIPQLGETHDTKTILAKVEMTVVHAHEIHGYFSLYDASVVEQYRRHRCLPPLSPSLPWVYGQKPTDTTPAELAEKLSDCL